MSESGMRKASANCGAEEIVAVMLHTLERHHKDTFAIDVKIQ